VIFATSGYPLAGGFHAAAAADRPDALLLTSDEVAAISAGCSPRATTGIRNRALLTLLYLSGLRISEAFALKPSDVDLKRHACRVLHGKGDTATVRGFHPTATDAFARWIDTRRGLGLRNGPRFWTLKGGQLYPQYVRILLGRLADKAGIEKRVHPHGLRHAFADELRAASVDVVVISKLFGHSSIAVTSRYLDHLTNDRAVAAPKAASCHRSGRSEGSATIRPGDGEQVVTTAGAPGRASP
jgi:integrase/recombinase XerD